MRDTACSSGDPLTGVAPSDEALGVSPPCLHPDPSHRGPRQGASVHHAFSSGRSRLRFSPVERTLQRGRPPPAPAACGLAEGTSAVRTPWGAGGALEREAGCVACCSSGFSISQRIFDLKKKSAFWHRSCCSRPSSKTSIPSAGSQRQGLGPGFFCLGGTIFTQVGPAEGAAVGETGPGGGAESDLATQGRPV